MGHFTSRRSSVRAPITTAVCNNLFRATVLLDVFHFELDLLQSQRYLPELARQHSPLTAHSALFKPSLKVFTKTKVNIMFPGSTQHLEWLNSAEVKRFLVHKYLIERCQMNTCCHSLDVQTGTLMFFCSVEQWQNSCILGSEGPFPVSLCHFTTGCLFFITKILWIDPPTHTR